MMAKTKTIFKLDFKNKAWPVPEPARLYWCYAMATKKLYNLFFREQQ